MVKHIALSLLLQAQPTWLEIGYAQDRCSMEGCLAEAVAPATVRKTIKGTIRHQTSVFYQENEFYLHYDLRKRIRDFLQKHPKQTTFVVTGWTDGCGEHDYNKELSRKRANEVARYILSMRRNASVKIKWKGEATGKHTINARRVDVTVFKKTQHPITPPKIVADFYLLDASGSMGAEWDKWSNAIAFWKPNHAKVYVANTGYIPYKSSLDDIRPAGGTEIWFAVWNILDLMEAGQTLAVVSDFNSNVPLSPSEAERIKNKARSKGVIINSLPL